MRKLLMITILLTMIIMVNSGMAIAYILYIESELVLQMEQDVIIAYDTLKLPGLTERKAVYSICMQIMR